MNAWSKNTNRTDCIHIWAISPLYYPNFGGAAVQAQEVYRKLLDHGLTVTVLASAQGEARNLAGHETNRQGVKVKYLSALFKEISWEASKKRIGVKNRISGQLSSIIFNIRAAWHLLRYGSSGDIAWIYAPGVTSFIPVVAARLRQMFPILQMTLLHSDDPEALLSHRNWLFRLLSIQAFAWASGITGYSTAQIESCRTAGINMRKVKRIPGGVDLDRFSPINSSDRLSLRIELGLKPDTCLILFVGSAISRKGIDIVIRSFIEVRKQIPQVELMLVGPCNYTDIDVPEEIQQLERLKNELEAWGYDPYVYWIGRKNNIEDYMRAADVFFFPTRREGFGIVIAEAMATGLPVIISKLEGVTTDIVQSEAEGLLVASTELSDYVGALMQVLNNADMHAEMREVARKRAEATFSLNLVAEKYADFFREIARRKQP